MQEPDAPSSSAPRPAAVFRTVLASAAAKERSSRARRPDRVQAIASLADDDLATRAQAFERLLNASADISAMATSLHATLRTLSPDAPSAEIDDA